MLKRWIIPKVEQTLKRVPAVALLGPRQIGKTTLAKLISESRPSIYLDFESPKDLARLEDPVSFLSQHADELVVLDEIQRKPDLFMALRGIIDKNRRAGKRGEQFLLLGSASMHLLRQSSESLAGRIHYIEMSGLNMLEINDDTLAGLHRLWLRGGFPDSYLSDSYPHSMEWLEMLIRTYLERDVPQMGFRIPAARLRRLWTMISHLQGETLNFSKLGSNLEVDGKTVSTYLDLLVDLMLVRRLEPWHENVKKRLVKSPRFYVRDSGILHRLLDINDYDGLLSHPVLGKSWEGFVVENIHSVLPNTVESYYYCTAAGAEIDLLLKFSYNDIWAIEIKNGAVPKVKGGFHQACDDIGATQRIVIHGGEDDFPLAHGVKAMSLLSFMRYLAQQLGDKTRPQD
jgi:predicted AAA+ superfamily ATPase